MDEGQREERILNIILIGSIAMLSILDAIVLFYSNREGTSDHEISFATFSILPAFFILLYLLARRGYSALASYLVVAAYLASAFYAAYRWGVTMQVVLITYALIIVIATILRGTRFGFLTTAIIAAFIIPLGYAQDHQMIRTQLQKERGADVIIFSVLYFLIMTVTWLYNREIESSMAQTQASENALKEERDSLEVKVIERTEELRRIQLEKAQELNRLAELGSLSSGLFHDLLNLLNAIALRVENEDDPSLANAFSTTKQIEGFMTAVKNQIGTADTSELFSLTKAIGHVIQLVHYKAGHEHVRIVVHVDSEDMRYLGVPFKFQEVVINLLLNSIEAYERLSNLDGRARTITVSLEKQGHMAVLTVEDNACGMTPDVQARMFEPFFSTKDGKRGIGIGLSTIKKIIEKDLGGSIVVETEAGIGSIFTVSFPIDHDEPQADHTGGAEPYSTTTIS